MTRGAIAAIGTGQCVNWGVLYYAFAVLVRPLQRELGVGTWVVTGAFSLALLMSALVAPTIGRWSDRDRGALTMLAGGIAASALLVAWTLTSSVLMLYVVWAALGLCMAATLYEPAFVIVGRAYADPARRLRALGAVTLLGGLASTVFLPATALLVSSVGWRSAVVVLALLLACATALTYVAALRSLPQPSSSSASADDEARGADERAGSPRLVFIAAAFGLGSLASAAFAANLVPALAERGVSAAAAAAIGGLIGVMQLPGRALLMNGWFAASPSGLLSLSLLLHAAGLVVVAFGESVFVVAGGTMVLALGAGLTTLVRPHLIQSLFDTRNSGHLNGRVARQQQLARAAGPLAVAWLAGLVGYTMVFTALAGTFAMMAMAASAVFGRAASADVEKEIA